MASIAIALAAPWAAEAKTAAYGFDAGNQGWDFFDGTGSSAADWSALTGVPPGAITGVDGAADSEPGASFRAPATVDGDYTPNIGGTIGFDFGTEDSPAAGRRIFLGLIDDSPTFPVAIAHELTPTGHPGFTRYSAPLSLEAWQYCAFMDPPPCPAATSAQFSSVIADVNGLVVLGDIVSGSGETYALDNVSVSEPPAPTQPVTPAAAAAAASTPSVTRRCPKGKKLVKKKGKRRCVRRKRNK